MSSTKCLSLLKRNGVDMRMYDLRVLQFVLLAVLFLVGVTVATGDDLRGCLGVYRERLDGGTAMPLRGVACEGLSFVGYFCCTVQADKHAGHKHN